MTKHPMENLLTYTQKGSPLFAVIHVKVPMQITCALFEQEHDAQKAAFEIIRENSGDYGLDARTLIAEHGLDVFQEWQRITKGNETVQLHLTPINVLNLGETNE